MGKTYSKILTNWSFRKIPAQKSKGADNYRIAIRQGLEQWIISNPTASGITPKRFGYFEELLGLKSILTSQEKSPLTISFIRKFGKKWVENIN